MNRKIVFLFSGQGSQYYNMGRGLYEHNKIFRKHMENLDGYVREKSGISIIEVLYNDVKKKGDLFDDLSYTHPAIFMVEHSLSMLFMELGLVPDVVMGTSLGEFSSLVTSEMISDRDLIGLLIDQAEIIKKHCSSAVMMAVLADPSFYESEPVLNNNSELVSVNFKEHFVITGIKNKIKLVEDYLNSRKIPYQILPVSYGFHSHLIDPAEIVFKERLSGVHSSSSSVPVFSCTKGSFLNGADVNSSYCWDVIRKPFFFSSSFNTLLNETGPSIFIDVGPGGTMSVFAKKAITGKEGFDTISIMTPFGNDVKNLDIVINKLQIKNKRKIYGSKKDMTTYVFPGQGSQFKGMGKDLFDEGKDILKKADNVLGYSVKDLCLNDPDGMLSQTQYTQPALYVVNALSYQRKIKETGRKPDFLAGHSLGEYNALLASGAFDFETGLSLVKKRGELMSMAKGGGMAAVIGLSDEKVLEIIRKNKLDKIDVANFNTPSQIVISGTKDDIEVARPYFESAGAFKYIVLNVSGAFHSRYMEDSMIKFKNFIEDFEIGDCQIPVISNVTARPYPRGAVKRLLVEQINHSVKWTESIRYIMGKGADKIEQVGPGTVLTGMIKNIKAETTPLVIADEIDNKENILPDDGEKTKAETPLAKSSDKSVENNVQEKAIESVFEKNASNKKNISVVENAKECAISAESLGCEEIKNEYKLKYAYMTGSMYKGIASKEIVVKMGKAGMLGFLGTGGLDLKRIEEDILFIKKNLSGGEPFGANLLYNPADQKYENDVVDLYLKNGVTLIEASAYMSATPALVRYKAKGLKKNGNGVTIANKIMGKVSRPEVAEVFLSPAPEKIISKLLSEGKISQEEAECAKKVPLADDLCVEADSGGHTDQGVAYALMPVMLKMRNDAMQKFGYTKKIRIGAAGGIGTPEAAAAAFILGADFILTGSINQCTVEAGTSDAVKNMLQNINVQDTEYAPAGDMFELGAKVQVLKKGVFFPARANKLYELYRQHNSLDEIDEKTRKQIQEKYFQKSFDEIYKEAKEFYPAEEIERANKNPKQKMAIIFKWYFGYSTRLALSGKEENRVDFQVHCGPALGAFNQWVRGTELENWRNRNVDKIAEKLVSETAELLNRRFSSIIK